MNKVFNADLAAAYNILMTPVTPNPGRGRGNGWRLGPGLNP
jgi:transposase